MCNPLIVICRLSKKERSKFKSGGLATMIGYYGNFHHRQVRWLLKTDLQNGEESRKLNPVPGFWLL